ncbi:MAG: translation elongation factor Ts [Gammaproteobacteria bacterium]|jgi:elongation factor Ts
MSITAAMVKDLRERTGAGMMECKKALTETNGDIEAAIELMRKSGAAKAVKKAGRIAAEGKIVVKTDDAGSKAVIVEINCETDFVAKDENFESFTDSVAQVLLDHPMDDLDALLSHKLANGQSVEDARQELVSKIGENIQIRRFQRFETAGDNLGVYTHGTRIGVVVDLKGGDQELAKDICMHIAASRPVCISEEQVPADLVEKEKQIFKAQAEESGKPAEIVEKMITGRIKKYLAEITLVGQPFVKNPDQTVGKLLSEKGAEVIRFIRYEVGEGIEKKQENFADEVMAQVKGA